MEIAILYILIIGLICHAISDRIKTKRFNKLIKELQDKGVITTTIE